MDLVLAERTSSYKARKTISIEIRECRISHVELASGDVCVATAKAKVRRRGSLQCGNRDDRRAGLPSDSSEDVRDRLETRWLIIDHYTAQFLSGHGDFRAKLE